MNRPPRNPPDALGEHDEVHIGINELLADRILQSQLADPLKGDLRTLQVIGECVIRQQAALMNQQIADRNGVFTMRRKLRDKRDHLVGETKLFPLHQEHDRSGGGDRLRNRGHVEDCVGRHRDGLRFDLPEPVRFEKCDFPVTAHTDDAARKLLLSEALGHERVDCGEPNRIEADGFGAGVRQPG